MQELLLPEQPAAAYGMSGLTTSHKWYLEFAGHCKEHHLMPTSLQVIYIGIA